MLGRLRRLIADRISVNKRNKHFRAGMSSDLRAFPHRCTAAAAAAPAPGNRSVADAVSPCCPATLSPIAATFLAQLQRPVKIAQIRDDAFAPDVARTAGEWAAGSRAGGRVEKVHWLVRSTCMQAFNRSRTRTRDLARLKQHCDPWPAHTDGGTEGQRDGGTATTVCAVCGAIHPAIDTRSRCCRCQPWIVAPLILPDLL